MSRIPLWMRLLRSYSLHTPFRRGTYRAALWLYQHLPVPDVEVEARLDQTLWVTLRLPIWVDYNIYALGLYEAPLARLFVRSLRSDSVVLDIGAYIGQYTLLAAKYAPKGQVIAFEPHAESCRRLKAHVARNRLINIDVLSQAVGQQPGYAPFALSEQPFSSSLLGSDQPSEASMEVEVTTVDVTIRKMDVRQVDLMKIDVEGAEGAVLRGAREVLSAHHPLLVVEIDHQREQAFGDSPETIFRYLHDLGYACYTLHRRHLVPTRGTSVTYENVIAVHG